MIDALSFERCATLGVEQDWNVDEDFKNKDDDYIGRKR